MRKWNGSLSENGFFPIKKLTIMREYIWIPESTTVPFSIFFLKQWVKCNRQTSTCQEMAYSVMDQHCRGSILLSPEELFV